MRISGRRARQLWLIVDERGDAPVIPDTGNPLGGRGLKAALLLQQSSMACLLRITRPDCTLPTSALRMNA